uniref:Uncharacterized protein n=1 Tax=Cacopsylla melanoneura TaxID=428564 RepID=A0A8D9EHP3_9HEMI
MLTIPQNHFHVLIGNVNFQIIFPRGPERTVWTKEGSVRALGRRTVILEVTRQMFLLTEVNIARRTLVVRAPVVLRSVLGQLFQLQNGRLVVQNRAQNGRVRPVLGQNVVIEIAQI